MLHRRNRRSRSSRAIARLSAASAGAIARRDACTTSRHAVVRGYQEREISIMQGWNTRHTLTDLRHRHAPWGAVLAAALAGCLGTSDERLDTAQAAQSSIVAIGNIGQNGMQVSFDEITEVSG